MHHIDNKNYSSEMSKAFEGHTALHFSSLSLERIRDFLKVHGKVVEHLSITIGGYVLASTFAEVLSSSPKLEKFYLYGDECRVTFEDEEHSNEAKIMKFSEKLPQIKLLNIISKSSTVFKFFAEILPANSIVEFHAIIDAICDENFIEIIQKIFKNQQEVQKISLQDLSVDQTFRWISVRLEKLEELTGTSGVVKVPETLELMPNLKILNVKTSFKLNSFAKFLKNLEQLTISYVRLRNSELLELDTKIVHENLKILKIVAKVENFWRFAKNLIEIDKIFPNLEEFKFETEKFFHIWDEENPGAISDGVNFFKTFNEMKKLQNLEIKSIPIKFCESKFPEIAEELRKLATKVENVCFEFQDRIDLIDDWQDFSYQNLIDDVRSDYRRNWTSRYRVDKFMMFKAEIKKQN